MRNELNLPMYDARSGECCCKQNVNVNAKVIQLLTEWLQN